MAISADLAANNNLKTAVNDTLSIITEDVHRNNDSVEIRRVEAEALQKEVNECKGNLEKVKQTRKQFEASSKKKCDAEEKQIRDMEKRLQHYSNKKRSQLEEKKTHLDALEKEKESLIQKSKQLEANLNAAKKRSKDVKHAMTKTLSKYTDLVAENADVSRKVREEFSECKRNASDRRKSDLKSIEDVKKRLKDIEMEIAKRKAVRKALESGLSSEDQDEENSQELSDIEFE